MNKKLEILILGLIILCCQQNELVKETYDTIYSITTVRNEPNLQAFIGRVTSSSARLAEEIMLDINKDLVVKIEKPRQNEEIYSIPTLSDPLVTVVMGIKDDNYYGYTISLIPDEDWNGGSLIKYSGQMLFHSLDGQLWLTATLRDGENVPREQAQHGRAESCWNSIDVYYTLSDIDGDGELEVTYIEFGDSYIECDPMDATGVPTTPDDGKEQPGGGGKKAGIIGLCPMGYEDVGDGCVLKCQQGEERNAQGDCVPRTEPCPEDPLINMKISTYNNGANSNRFGCVRVGKTNCDGKQRHGGIDLMAPEGTSVFSMTSGEVVYVQENHKDLGNWIIIHSGSLYYAYAHLKNKPDFSVGSNVSALEIIGEVSDTGNAPDGQFHLHLTIKEQTVENESYNNAVRVDPEDYLGTQFDSNGNAIKNENC